MNALASPGTKLGAYRLIELIGEGGIGLVYRAEHIMLGRRVALKILRSELASNPNTVSRFFGEARAVNEIAHENIVQITDFFEGDQERPSYYIMEYLEGCTLLDLVTREQPSIDRVLSVGVQMASALAAVHAKQIVHRDLKPENVFIVEDGRRSNFVKLLDFGAAKLSEVVRVGDPITRAGVLVGTPRYMSPEQILGDEVDHRADLYALGAVLFEMTTGRPVFEEGTLERILLRHVEEEPVRPSAMSSRRGRERIPGALDDLILQCLQKVARDRPASASDVHRRLQRMIDARRRRWGLPAIATVSLAAAGMVLAMRAIRTHATEAVPISIAPISIAPRHAPPVEPERVTVYFDSDPPGAQVREVATARSLGRTPLTSTFERGAASSFTFRLSGYRPSVQTIELASDAHVKVALIPRPKKTEKTEKTEKKQSPPAPLSKSALRNPFQ